MKVECPRCHTHVDAPATGDPVCPTCGFSGGDIAAPSSQAAQAPSNATGPAYGEQPKTGLALTAMILGIVGFLTGFLFFGIFLDVAAIVIGIVAIVKANKEPELYGGKGMAITGLVVGSLGLVFMILILASFGALMDFAVEECRNNPDQPNCDQILEEYGDEVSARPGLLSWPAPQWSWAPIPNR